MKNKGTFTQHLNESKKSEFHIMFSHIILCAMDYMQNMVTPLTSFSF